MVPHDQSQRHTHRLDLALAAKQHAGLQQTAAGKTAHGARALLQGSPSFYHGHTLKQPTTAQMERIQAACLYFDMVFLAGTTLSHPAVMRLGEHEIRSCAQAHQDTACQLLTSLC